MKDVELLENGKLVFHSYDALKAYCDKPENPFDRVVLGKEITSLRELFLNSSRTYEQFAGIGEWDVSNVNNMACMFYGAKSFNQPIGNWDVSKVWNMSGMFYRASTFNQPLNNWDVSNVEDMSDMFLDASTFNQPLDNWNVSNVTDMSSMFLWAEKFNQPLDNWDVSRVEDMSYMFYRASTFNQPLDNWEVSNVRSMSGMFYEANSFNQPLNNWNVSNVEEMMCMFRGAERFNQPLDNFSLEQKKQARYHFDEVKYKKNQANKNNSSSNSGYIDKVIKLAELREKGLLSEVEFEKIKEDLLKQSCNSRFEVRESELIEVYTDYRSLSSLSKLIHPV